MNNAEEFWNFILKEGEGQKDSSNRNGMTNNDIKRLVILLESPAISISAKRWEMISEEWLVRIKTLLIRGSQDKEE